MNSSRAKAGLFMFFVMLSSSFAGCFGEDILQADNTKFGNEKWSDDYRNMIYPWDSASNEKTQFKAYHDYFSMKERMQELAEQNPNILEFHEGLNGGMNARGEQTSVDTYEGWYYGHSSPWLKITGNVQGGEYNDFNGDNGNYADRDDVMLVGNHHAREWMSYEVPMFFLETLVFSYDNIGYDNDGDGLVDEDGWDGIDNDGDCLSQDEEVQDTNNDGLNCGPGDLGVDEDYSEQWITDLVNQREIYLIPMLNVDGNRYDHEVWVGDNCGGGEAWENCRTSGWRKNLRDNTVTGVTPVPDPDEQVDPTCDGVDLNRNYQFEWGAPLGATGPLFPGMCYAGDAGANNDVYNGPVDTVDQDNDGRLNEDHVDGNDDDADGLIDEDWMGGNSEPETKFIQDMTEMNDDNMDGASEFKTTLTWHSFSELVLYPWGHCTNCDNPDQEQLKYHGDWMAQLTTYANMQSSDLYPTTGDFCDWHYGVHGSYCYTMEIGNAFHESPEDIDHISQLNLGVPFYMIEIADNPRERAEFNLSINTLQTPEEVLIPELGSIPIDLCIDENFPVSLDSSSSHVMFRTVKPTRSQSDYGPREWSTESWQASPFEKTEIDCSLPVGNESGVVLRSHVPIADDFSGRVHYKVMLSTLDGSNLIEYPSKGDYYTLDVEYRAPFGTVFGSIALFAIIAVLVWGSLGLCLRMMLDEDEGIHPADQADEVLDAELDPGDS
jgi:hypothetical protein